MLVALKHRPIRVHVATGWSRRGVGGEGFIDRAVLLQLSLNFLQLGEALVDGLAHPVQGLLARRTLSAEDRVLELNIFLINIEERMCVSALLL